jgi:hypothetical protein
VQRAGSRTGGSGNATGASALRNEKFWRERAAERVVLGQPGSRTIGSGAAGLQNKRFWGSWALERAVLATCGFYSGWVCSGQVPERAVLAVGQIKNGECWCEHTPEREVLVRMDTRTRGSRATRLQNGRFWQRAGSRARKSAGKSQKEAWKTRGSLKHLRGVPLIFYFLLVRPVFFLAPSWAPWNSFQGSTVEKIR